MVLTAYKITRLSNLKSERRESAYRRYGRSVSTFILSDPAVIFKYFAQIFGNYDRPSLRKKGAHFTVLYKQPASLSADTFIEHIRESIKLMRVLCYEQPNAPAEKR